jgi:hypothetical protein
MPVVERWTARSGPRIRYLDNAPGDQVGLPILFSPGLSDLADAGRRGRRPPRPVPPRSARLPAGGRELPRPVLPGLVTCRVAGARRPRHRCHIARRGTGLQALLG